MNSSTSSRRSMKKKRYIQRQRVSDSRNLLNTQSRVVVNLLCLGLLLSFAVAIAYPRWRAWIDWRDEGLLAYGAVRVLNGEVPHRDFVSLQPPLSYYTAAIVFKLLGTSLLSLRVF